MGQQVRRVVDRLQPLPVGLGRREDDFRSGTVELGLASMPSERRALVFTPLFYVLCRKLALRFAGARVPRVRIVQPGAPTAG